jgi:hypothetical protein
LTQHASTAQVPMLAKGCRQSQRHRHVAEPSAFGRRDVAIVEIEMERPLQIAAGDERGSWRLAEYRSTVRPQAITARTPMFSPSSIGLQVLDRFGWRRTPIVGQRSTIRPPDRELFSH